MTGTTTTGTGTPGTPIGTSESLSNWAGPYVTDMLGKGWALSETPYTAYEGPLTAGPSALQNKAFSGLAGLALPTNGMGSFTPGSFTDAGTANQYMSPFLGAAMEPQIAEARRQAEIDRIANAGRMTKAGSFGGSRQAIMESEGDRNLNRLIADITGKGYQSAYESGRSQFNTEQNMGMEAQQFANEYGFDALQAVLNAGQAERGIESEGITADYNQFKDERDDPFKKVQYMQSLLQGLPVEARSTTYEQPSGLASLLGAAEGGLSLIDRISAIFNPPASGTTT